MVSPRGDGIILKTVQKERRKSKVLTKLLMCRDGPEQTNRGRRQDGVVQASNCQPISIREENEKFGKVSGYLDDPLYN